jgi:hypothetical protein
LEIVYLKLSGCLKVVMGQFPADDIEKTAPGIFGCSKKNIHSSDQSSLKFETVKSLTPSEPACKFFL